MLMRFVIAPREQARRDDGQQVRNRAVYANGMRAASSSGTVMHALRRSRHLCHVWEGRRHMRGSHAGAAQVEAPVAKRTRVTQMSMSMHMDMDMDM